MPAILFSGHFLLENTMKKVWVMWDSFSGGRGTPRIFASKAQLDAAIKQLYLEYKPKIKEEKRKISFKNFVKDLHDAGMRTEEIDVE